MGGSEDTKTLPFRFPNAPALFGGDEMRKLSVLIIGLFLLTGCATIQDTAKEWMQKSPKEKYSFFAAEYIQTYDEINALIKDGIQSERLDKRVDAITEARKLLDEYEKYADINMHNPELEIKIIQRLTEAR